MYLKLISLLLLPVLNLGSFNYTNCDQAKQPKFMSSCCNVHHHDPAIESCRMSLPKQNERMDKVKLHACMAECVFRNNNYLFNNGSVNVKAMESNYQQQYSNDPIMSQLMIKSLNLCGNYARKRSQEFQWLNTHGECDYMPATLMACIMEQVYESCPTSRWKNSNECQAMRKFLLACDDVRS